MRPYRLQFGDRVGTNPLGPAEPVPLASPELAPAVKETFPPSCRASPAHQKNRPSGRCALRVFCAFPLITFWRGVGGLASRHGPLLYEVLHALNVHIRKVDHIALVFNLDDGVTERPTLRAQNGEGHHRSTMHPCGTMNE